MAQGGKQTAELEYVAGVAFKGPPLVTYTCYPCSIAFEIEPGARREAFKASACGAFQVQIAAAHLHHSWLRFLSLLCLALLHSGVL